MRDGILDGTDMNIAAKPPLTIRLCGPRGFCAGVDRAIQIVVLALKSYGAPVYVRHEIVHNRYVVEGLEAKGAVQEAKGKGQVATGKVKDKLKGAVDRL